MENIITLSPRPSSKNLIPKVTYKPLSTIKNPVENEFSAFLEQYNARKVQNEMRVLSARRSV